MSAISLAGWVSKVRNHYRAVVPHCGEPGCSFARRLWRRIRWWNGTIRLHGSPYCAPQCLQNAIRQCFVHICDTTLSERPIQHRIPLGLLMLSRGQLSNPQLRSALAAQQATGQHRLGEWLERLGFATEQQVTAALGLQWACPVLTAKLNPDHRCVRLIPFRLLETYRMLPTQFVEASRTFYIAFSDGLDYSVLYAVEQMLNCRTEAFLISHSAMEQALEQIGRDRSAGDLLFEGWRHAPEMARITCSYVLKLGAEDVRLVGCGDYIWARLSAGRQVANLIFRRPSAFRQQPATFDESVARQISG